MKKYLTLTFQLAAVFIGTIVGAGLASGEEISLFFSRYGYKSFIGILLCLIVYIVMGFIIIHISVKYNLKSYNEFIKIVSPGFLGKIIDILMGVFLFAGSAIILAGSGAIINQYFHVSKWIGIFFMVVTSLFVLLRDTDGLLEINSFIVPCLIVIVITIFLLFISLSKDIVSISHIKTLPHNSNNWLISSLLYASFNIISCSGVIVPLSSELKVKGPFKAGIVVGAIILTLLSFMINFMLILNIPNIFKYDIPLLYIANRFGHIIQISLLCIMWLEMFSTEVSHIYSLGKAVENSFNLSYKKSVVVILLLTIPICNFGFSNLISYIYPAFGAISLVFVIQCIVFYYKNK